jgi:hypothetical protein
MINIINTASDTMINASTVSDIGICYYDYETETLKELSSLIVNACSVIPMSGVIKKYYLIAENTYSYAKIRLIAENTDKLLFDAKVIINEIEPSINDFDNLTSFNTATVTNPLTGHLIPVWIYIEQKISSSTSINMTLELEAN